MTSRLYPPARASALAAACLLAAAPAVAAAAGGHDERSSSSSSTLPDVVVTTTRSTQPLTDVLADFTLIDERQIAQSGAATVADMLARQPGLEMTRNGGPGTATSVMMRGAESRFIAVYVDGVRMDLQIGGAPWEALPLAQVERIEIVRGPAAAVYGSDAIAGAVQIFTRRAAREGFAPYAGVGAGSRGLWKADAGFAVKNGAADYALGASHEQAKGYSVRTGGNPDRDGWRNTNASASAGYQLNDQHRLQASALWGRMKAQYDDFTSSPANWADDWGDNRVQTLAGTWAAQWSRAWRTTATLSHAGQRYETRPSPYLNKTRQRTAQLHSEWREGPHLAAATLERRHDHLENDPIVRSRHQTSLNFIYGFSHGPHTLQANLRREDDSDFGGHTGGSLAYGWRFAPEWRVSAAAGRALRMPTLYQRFSQYGQAGLKPETGRNVELGLHWARQGSQIDLTVYRNRVRNLIVFGAAGPCAASFGCYHSIGRAQYEGVALSGTHRIASVRLTASIDVQRPKDLDSDKLLPRRSRRIAKLAADTRIGLWDVGAEWQAHSRRFDDRANRNAMAGYGLLNLYASATFARQWTLLARIDNATNTRYETARGYPQPARSFYVGLRWAMP